MNKDIKSFEALKKALEATKNGKFEEQGLPIILDDACPSCGEENTASSGEPTDDKK